MTFLRFSDRVFPVAAAVVMLAMILPGTALANQDIPAGIVIYTVSTAPVSVPRELASISIVVNLDRALAIEAQLAAGLDRLPEHRRAAAASGKMTESLSSELERIWQGVFRLRNDLTHLPAIVFDDRAVWYGSDLRRAITKYRYRRKAGGDL